MYDFNFKSNVNSVRFKHIFPYAYIDVTLLNPYHDYIWYSKIILNLVFYYWLKHFLQMCLIFLLHL